MRNTAFKIIPIIIVIAGLLPGGCGEVSMKIASINIAGLVIYNKTSGPLYDIKLKVEKTGTVVTCNFIPPGRSFSTEFPLRRYQGNSVNAAYYQNGRVWKTGEMHADIPERLVPNQPVFAVVAIQANGDVVVRLEQ